MSIEKLRDMINDSSNIVFFGGAGVSTESNIPDFRSQNGIFSALKKYNLPPERLISHSFFVSNPDTFFDYYKSQMLYPKATPNPAHYALAKLEEMGKLKAVVTQNIDGLHQMAGSQNVLELHGSIHQNYCLQCGKTYDLNFVVHSKKMIPACEKCGGTVRPDVVLYEEGLSSGVLDAACSAIANADMLIVGGTSLVVYPAAGLIHYFKGDNIVLINKSETGYDNKAKLVLRDSIGEVFERVMQYFL